jgi:hypothetical protein
LPQMHFVTKIVGNNIYHCKLSRDSNVFSPEFGVHKV